MIEEYNNKKTGMAKEKNGKVIIGNCDYSREQLERNDVHELTIANCSARQMLEVIKGYEAKGYIVKFETSLFRRIFCLGRYRIVAYPPAKTKQAATGAAHKKVVIRTGTVTINGVSRPMTEAEMNEVEAHIGDVNKMVGEITDSMDKHFANMDKLFKRFQ